MLNCHLKYGVLKCNVYSCILFSFFVALSTNYVVDAFKFGFFFAIEHPQRHILWMNRPKCIYNSRLDHKECLQTSNKTALDNDD